VDVAVWQVLGVLGVGLLVHRRQKREQVLLLGPLVLMVLFNALGSWPLGAFRTNLFTLVYAAALAGVALERRRETAPAAWDLVPVGALVVLPFLLLGNTKHDTKWAMSADSAFPEALKALGALRAEVHARGRSQLVLDAASCSPFRYYTRYHPRRGELEDIRTRFNAYCVKDAGGFARVLREGLKNPRSRAFALLTRARSKDEIRQLPEDLEIDAETVLGKQDQLVVRVKRR
jgi:hypothetical protein